MKRTERTLAEQIKLNRLEFDNRKQLLDFGSEDIYNLKKVGPRIDRLIDKLVSEFYEQQTSIDDVALIIGDADTLSRLSAAQRQYILDLFSGFYDMTYANNRLRIGLVHKRIGVGPKYYLSAMQLLKNILFRTIREIFADKNEAEAVINSLEKLLTLDIQLVFDAYIRSLVAEVETSMSKVQNYAENLEQEVSQRTRELKELSQQDPLTDLYNRRAMLPMLNRDLANAERQSVNVAIVYIDADNFKILNDTYGHAAGDRMLLLLSESLHDITREGDLACRMGGDEFCVFLLDADEKQALSFAQRLIARFSDKSDLEATLSIGICVTGPNQFLSSSELIHNADEAMYEAKKTQGNKVVCYSELSQSNEQENNKPLNNVSPLKPS